jgi:hypothetical protein
LARGIVERQQIHQVEMPHVVAADVVVPLEIAAVGIVAVTEIPVARRANAMQHAAIVQHRQIETAAVPGNDLRREFLDAVEKALDDFAFASAGSASDQTFSLHWCAARRKW